LYSIKKSFANCLACPLLEAPSCILETNCEDDLTKVEIVFVAENPGKNEVKDGFPLIGKAGKMFRKYFKKFGIDKMKYLLTNTVLCQTLDEDGTTGNPESNVIDLCKTNCMNIIEVCKPKMIVIMGSSPLAAFGIAKAGITKLHGNVVEWNGYKTVIMVHPSFVNRNTKLWEPKFEEVMGNIAVMMGGKADIKTSSGIKTMGKGIFRYKIPEHFYTDKYRLVDVQFLTKTQQVLYIFRDKNNNKVYHKMNDKYVCYQAPNGVEARRIVPYDQLNQVAIKYKDKYDLDPEITYEGDLRITVKHAMDYYYLTKGEAPKIKNNVMFVDIEIDTGKERVFPNQTEAKFPINLISSRLNGVNITYILDNKTEPIKQINGVQFKIFTNEKDLLKEFVKDFRESECDFVSGWNLINFDMEYISNRLPRVGLKVESLSKFSEFYIDSKRYICHLPGVVVVDQDFVYKTFTFTKMENYKLGFIAEHELDGYTKIDLPLPFNEMYWKMLNTTIEYNVRDTELLEKLDKKLAHINLLNELRFICNTSFDSVSSFGQIDSLMVSHLRNKGLASKNSDPHIVKEKYPGAFVFDPTPGIYDWITDFDFASLYPSLIITYNIGVETIVMKIKDPTLGYDLTYNQDSLPENIEIVFDPLFEKRTMTVTKKQLLDKIKEQKLVTTINGCLFKPHKSGLSTFGNVVDMLMSSRKEYKGKMFDAIEAKDEAKENFYYTRQLVYKVLANTLYGVVANKAFRFFDVSLAAAITLSGQEALKTSIINGDAFLRHLKSGKQLVLPKQLTKKEMYSDEMPERSNEFVITGDTDSIFCCFQTFRDKDIKSILGWCKEISNFLNEKKMIEIVNKHNVDLDYNRLKLKNELIISRGLFLAKKRYVIRVVNNEGKDVDKINYMGVEIKRSDYPRKSKEFLSDLSELLLKSEKVSLSKLLQYVERVQKDFVKLIANGDKTVARPVTYGKKLEDYKSIPQGVRAMEAWNNIMYPIHKTGAKSYMYWIRGINFDKISDPEEREQIRKKYDEYISKGNKLEVIAIPDEESRLPEYFEPDLRSALKFVFIDRYKLMLQPLLEVKQKSQLLTI